MGMRYPSEPSPHRRKAVGITLAPGTGRVTALAIAGVPLLAIMLIGVVTAHSGSPAEGRGPTGTGLYSAGIQYPGDVQPTPAETQPPPGSAVDSAGGTASTVPATAPATTLPVSPATITPAATSPATQSGVGAATGPAATVIAAYAAINRHDYQTAYSLGLGEPQPGETLQQYAAGYATTAKVTVTITQVQGDTVTVSLNALQTDGTEKRFSGTYTISGGRITGSQIQQTS